MIQIKNILFPTDFSELSLTALKYSVQFARDYEAKLHVIHVVDEAYQYWMSMAPSTIPLGGAPLVDDVVKNSQASLKRLVAEKVDPAVEAVQQILIGRPYVEIVNYAKKEAINLIVIGTHGRGGLSHMLLGSVAEKVVRKAPCPVLIVHQPEHEFVLP